MPALFPLRVALAAVAMVSGALASETAVPTAQQEVRASEQAFAQTLADRDFAAFMSFVSPEAVFFDGAEVLRGARAVADAWRAYFDGPEPPFSWRPETVEVLESGQLALSSGPVLAADGRRVGTFNSIWRRNADGAWKVVFDKGERACPE